MAGDVTEQTTRAQKWLAGQKWKLREYRTFRPRSEIDVIERFLVDVPRELLKGLVEYLVATATEINPQLEGKPFAGTWTFTKHSWERSNPEKDDNLLTFVQTMTTGLGASAGFVVENGCAYIVTQTFYWDVAALPDVPAGTSGIEYEIQSVFRDRDTGLLSCVLEKRERIMQTIGLYVTEQGAAEQVSEQQFLGVRTDDKDQTGTAVALQDMTLEAGKIKVRRRKKNRDCTQDIEEQSREGVDQTSTDWEKGHAEDATETKATQGATAITEPTTPAAGTIVEVVQEPTLFGRLRQRIRTRTAKNQTASSWQKNHAETAVDALATQDAVATEPSAPTVGTIVELDQEPTLFGLFRKRTRTRTAVDQTSTDWQKGHAEDVEEAKATQGTAITEPTSPSAGTIVEVVQEPTIFGRVRKALRTRTAKNQTASSWQKNHAETVAEALATQDTVATEPSAPTAGTIVEVDQEPTLFGLFRKRSRTRTAVDQPSTGGETRADMTRATVTATQADAAASATRSAGEITAAAIVRADSRPTPFGKFATDRMVETPVKLVKTFAVDTHEKLTLFTNHTTAEVNALLTAGAVVPAGWTPGLSVQPTGYLDGNGECLWTGTVRAVSRVRTLRPKWDGFSETGIVESSFVLREFKGKLYKVVRTETYNYVGDFDIEDGLGDYKALNPKDGSRFTQHDSQNYYVYKAVTDVTVTATDVTAAFEAGTEITI